jgi:hypothetical protein
MPIGNSRLPTVLSIDKVRSIFGAVRTPQNKAYLTTVYACGLRLNEALTFRSVTSTVGGDIGVAPESTFSFPGKSPGASPPFSHNAFRPDGARSSRPKPPRWWKAMRPAWDSERQPGAQDPAETGRKHPIRLSGKRHPRLCPPLEYHLACTKLFSAFRKVLLRGQGRLFSRPHPGANPCYGILY